MPGKPTAVLLLGPTGSGKTPLGRKLEENGLSGRRAIHFDFGAELRSAAAEAGRSAGLDAAELEVVKRSLVSGALLEDEEFPVALKVLRAFLHRLRPTPVDLLVLNGLPRHAGQAERMENLVDIRLVVVLEATAEVAGDRVGRDVGKDRAGRPDDKPADVRRKLELYERRTRPLVETYASRGVTVLRLSVGTEDTAEDIYEAMRVRGEVVS
ncbi:MAG: nucleoside monophosphate kinase [Candidatus Aminicenantes bacterium]|nr:nucleoside monophosphate kinase [Candidatus Aminicenantes bacterium]